MGAIETLMEAGRCESVPGLAYYAALYAAGAVLLKVGELQPAELSRWFDKPLVLHRFENLINETPELDDQLRPVLQTLRQWRNRADYKPQPIGCERAMEAARRARNLVVVAGSFCDP